MTGQLRSWFVGLGLAAAAVVAPGLAQAQSERLPGGIERSPTPQDSMERAPSATTRGATRPATAMPPPLAAPAPAPAAIMPPPAATPAQPAAPPAPGKDGKSSDADKAKVKRKAADAGKDKAAVGKDGKPLNVGSPAGGTTTRSMNAPPAGAAPAYRGEETPAKPPRGASERRPGGIERAPSKE